MPEEPIILSKEDDKPLFIDAANESVKVTNNKICRFEKFRVAVLKVEAL